VRTYDCRNTPHHMTYLFHVASHETKLNEPLVGIASSFCDWNANESFNCSIAANQIRVFAQPALLPCLSSVGGFEGVHSRERKSDNLSYFRFSLRRGGDGNLSFSLLYFCVFREWLHVRPVAGMPPAICCSARMVSIGSLTFLGWMAYYLLV